MAFKKIKITDYNMIMVIKSHCIGKTWLQIVYNDDDMFMILLYNDNGAYLFDETIYLSSALQQYNDIINMIDAIMM